MRGLLYTLGSILVVLSTIPALVSLVLHLQTPWTKTAVGRNLTGYSAVIAAVMTTWLIGLLTGTPPWWDVVRLVVFSLVPVVLWWRVFIQFRLRRDRRKDAAAVRH